MAIDLDAIRNKLNQLSGNNSKRSTMWRPQEGEEVTVRLLSFPDNDGQPFQERWFYYNIGNNPGLLAPYQFGKNDPIQELITKLRDDGSKESYELAKKLYPKMRCYAPVVVRGEEARAVGEAPARDEGDELLAGGREGVATERVARVASHQRSWARLEARAHAGHPVRRRRAVVVGEQQQVVARLPRTAVARGGRARVGLGEDAQLELQPRGSLSGEVLERLDLRRRAPVLDHHDLERALHALAATQGLEAAAQPLGAPVGGDDHADGGRRHGCSSRRWGLLASGARRAWCT